MATTITLRNLAESTQRVLKHRAVDNGRSFEAEIRAILDRAATSPADDAAAVASPLFAAAAEFRASVADLDFALPERLDESPW